MSFNFLHIIRTDDFSPNAGGGHGAVITRDNYEAYFVMYVDDELNATERKAVEQFITQNPDLEEEMVMLQQSVLLADDHIVFEHKELLLKGDEQTEINEHNCSAYFVRYGDDELTNAEKDKVEQFVYHHPQYQADFELIQQIKLVPDNAISFPDKTYLYRSEEDDNRVIAFPWWRFSAAAVAILVIGTLAWYIVNNTGNTGTQRDVVKETSPAQSNDNNKLPQVILPDNSEVNSVAVKDTPTPANTTTTNKQPDDIAVEVSNKKNNSKESNKPKDSYVQTIYTPTPEQDPETPNKVLPQKPVEVAVKNSNETPAVKSAVIKSIVTEPVPVHTVAAKTEDEPDQSSTYVLNAPINKTPLRGFFRKVSRVVERVTNPEENGRKGVRIANLEIALN
jgi:tellurite resistance protein